MHWSHLISIVMLCYFMLHNMCYCYCYLAGCVGQPGDALVSPGFRRQTELQGENPSVEGSQVVPYCYCFCYCYCYFYCYFLWKSGFTFPRHLAPPSVPSWIELDISDFFSKRLYFTCQSILGEGLGLCHYSHTS